MKKKLKNVKWGIIGVGDVCEIKSAPAMNKIDHSSIEIIMRRDEAKLVDYAKRHAIPKWTLDPHEVINHPDVNAIYIATPPAYHAEYTIEAAGAGKPVYVEKPMARTSSECEQMIDACKAAGVPLFVAYYRRALPNFLKVKELLDARAIGDIRMVHIDLYQPLSAKDKDPSNWRVNPEIAGDGYFYDLASHQLDLMDFLFGPIKNAKGMTKNQTKRYDADDLVTGLFEFESGLIGSGNWCFNSSPDVELDRTTIFGSEGTIEFSTFQSSDVKITTSKYSSLHQFDSIQHIQQPLIQQVVDELRGKGKCVTDGKTAARANQVMEWITN